MKDHVFGIRLSRVDLHRLDAIAAREGISRSEVMRQLLSRAASLLPRPTGAP